MKKVNYMVAFVLIVYPLLIVLSAYAYWARFGISTFEIVCVVASFYGFCVSVGVGIHRLWAHSAYKTNKVVELFLTIISSGTLQGPILTWCSNHDRHHAFTDVLGKDPHTPLKYCHLEENGYSTKGKLKGFLWSHMGWMLRDEESEKPMARTALRRFEKNKIVMWQFRNYWKIALLMNTLLPFCIGYAVGGTVRYGIAGFIFIGLGRAIQQQATFCINSLVHFFGTKKYVNGTAGDIPLLFFIFLGENWHNFHHAFPRDYRNGHKWYHLDIHKWIIALMGTLGLATDIRRTPKERIARKVEIARTQIATNMKEQLIEANTLLVKILDSLAKKIDSDFDKINVKANTKLLNLKKRALMLKDKTESVSSASKIIKPKETKKLLTNFKCLEADFFKYVGHATQ